MSLPERIEVDFKQALRHREPRKVSCLRLIKAALKNKEIENRGALDESQVLSVLTTLVKQRKESLELFQKGGRDDLVRQEQEELNIIEGYLPKPLSEKELIAIIEQAVNALGAAGPKDMGKVMKAIMPKVQGRADGKRVNELVKAALSKG